MEIPAITPIELTGDLIPLPDGPLENGALYLVLLRDFYGIGRHSAVEKWHVANYWIGADEADAYDDGPMTVEQAEYVILGKVERARRLAA